MSNEKWKCPKCGTENDLENIFCGDCGTKRPEIKPGVAERVVPKPANQETKIQKGEPEKKDNKSIITGSENQKIKSEAEISRNKVKIVAIVSVLIAFLAALGAGIYIFEKHFDETSRTGTQWSNRSSKIMNWNAAKQYCANLSEGGFTDWRLPNIDELRTTIRNCSKTETGGECKVSEKNGRLSRGDWNPDGSCYCESRNNNGGYYSKLGDDDNVWLWSSSTRSDDTDRAWRVGFISGLVLHSLKSYYYYVRCVR